MLTVVSFTLLLVSVNMILTVALIQLVSKLSVTAHDANVFLASIRAVKTFPLRSVDDDEYFDGIRHN